MQFTHSRRRSYPPNRRITKRSKHRVGNISVFIDVGYYPDGKPCEVFITGVRTGSAIRELLNALAQIISVSLQCGIGVREFYKTMFKLNTPQEHGFDPTKVVAIVFDELSKPFEEEITEVEKPVQTTKEIIPMITKPTKIFGAKIQPIWFDPLVYDKSGNLKPR